MNKRLFLFSVFIIFVFSSFILSCANMRQSYVVVDNIISKERTIVIASFTFPKNMTNQNLDKLKYLNTEIYADFVLGSFITNFNSQNDLVKLITLEEALGKQEFSKLSNHSIFRADYVAATGTLAANILDEETANKILNNYDGIMFANSYMSFWSQNIIIDFRVYEANGSYLWVDRLNGKSYHIIGDTGSPTRQTAYEIVIADVVRYQQRHGEELYTVIDEAISNGINGLKERIPYAFSTNDILFTQKTFSLTNENYSEKAGIN